MANSFTVDKLVDGPNWAVLNVKCILDTSDLAVTDLVDPTTLSNTSPYGAPTDLVFYGINYAVEDGLTVNLWWDATADVLLDSFNGRGAQDHKEHGGLPNKGGAGKTGKIQISTEGWSGVKSFSMIIRLRKVGP